MLISILKPAKSLCERYHLSQCLKLESLCLSGTSVLPIWDTW